jgi:hypothetical protein
MRELYYQLHTGVFLGSFFDPEDGGDMILRNVGCLSTDYTALYPRRQYYSKRPEYLKLKRCTAFLYGAK